MKAALLVPTLVGLTHAWGDLGHETIGWIAQSYVSSVTKSAVQGVLGTTDSDYMAYVATWADTYRYTSAGRFSEPYHFIDANDSPPSSCSVDYDRDCGDEGCSVSAIVCSNVLVNGVDSVENVDLSGSYYNDNHAVALTQIAKAGYRLGAWLNLIYSGSTS